MEKELIAETFDVPLVSSSVVDSAGSIAPTASGGGAGVLHHHEAVVPLALPAGLGGPSALPLQLCHSGGGSVPENCDSCYESDETQSVGNHSNATPSLSAGSDTLKAEHCDTINDVPTTTTTTTHQQQQLHMHQQQLPAEHPHSTNNKHPLHKHHPHLQHADSVKRQFEAAQCMAISVNNNNNDNDVVAVVATDNMDAKQQQQLRQQLQRIVVTASSSCNSCTSAATDCNSSSSSYKRTDGNVGSCKANDTIAMGTTRNDNDNMLHMHNTVQHAQGNAASSSGVLPSSEMSSQRHPYDSETTDVVVEAADSEGSEDEDVTLWAGYSAKLDFALKLGYEERALQTILREEGPHVTKNVLLERLIACHGENTSSGEDCDSAERRVDIGDNNNYCDQQEYCEGDDKRDLPANDDMLRAIREDPESNLRFIVVDGSNVAMSHGQKQVFSCMGIKLAVEYFTQRGHTNIVVFVPSWRKETPKADTPITDQDILLDLEREKRLVFTPSRRVNGRRVVCYDDLYILNLAVMKDAVVVSNDVYRDLIRNDKYKHVIENRLLMFSFANDCFMPPDDPLGRHGPSLDNFLCKHPVAPEPAPKICPYLKKCTYGHKCKFLHPERKNQPLQSVTDKLAEQTKAKRKEALERVAMPAVSREASPVPPSKTKLHKTSSSEFISSHKKALSRTSSLNKVPVQKKQLTRTHSLVPESSPALVTKEKLSPKKSVPVGPTPSAAEIFGQAARATSPEQQRPAVTIANKPKCEVTVSPPRYTSPLSPIVSDEREAFAELEHLTLESDKSPGPGDRLKTPTHDPLRATTSAPDQNENARSAGFTCKELLSGHVAFAMALSEETKSASKSSPQLYHSEHTAEHMRHSAQPLVLQPPPLQRPQTQNIQPSQQQPAKPKEKMALTRQLSLTGSDDPRVIQQQQRLGIQQPQQPRAIFHDAQRPKTSVHHALSHPIGGIHEEQNYLGMEDGATAPVEATQMEQFSKMKLGPMTSAPVTMQSDYHRDRSASPNVMGNEYYMPDPNAGVAHAAQTWNSQQNVQLEHPQSATTTSASTVPTFRFHSSSNPQWMMSMSPRHRRHQAVGGHVYPAARKGINDANFYRTQPPPLMNPQPGHMVGLMAMPPTTVTGSHPQLQDQPPLIPAADVPFDNLTSRTGYRSMTNLPVDSLGGATVEAPYRPHYGSQGHLSNTAGATLAPAPAPQGPAAAIPGGPGAPPSGPALLAGPTDIDPRSSNVSSDRNELYNNLCKFFPSNKVLQIMSRYPLESDSHVLLKYLLEEKIT